MVPMVSALERFHCKIVFFMSILNLIKVRTTLILFIRFIRQYNSCTLKLVKQQQQIIQNTLY